MKNKLKIVFPLSVIIISQSFVLTGCKDPATYFADPSNPNYSPGNGNNNNNNNNNNNGGLGGGESPY